MFPSAVIIGLLSRASELTPLSLITFESLDGIVRSIVPAGLDASARDLSRKRGRVDWLCAGAEPHKSKARGIAIPPSRNGMDLGIWTSIVEPKRMVVQTRKRSLQRPAHNWTWSRQPTNELDLYSWT